MRRPALQNRSPTEPWTQEQSWRLCSGTLDQRGKYPTCGYGIEASAACSATPAAAAAQATRRERVLSLCKGHHAAHTLAC